MSGINVKVAQKWLYQGAHSPLPFRIEGPVDDLGGGSWNMQGLRAVLALVSEQEDGEDRMLAYCRKEALVGHTGGEILTDSHAQLYYSLWSHALKYGLAHNSDPATRIYEAALRWLRNQFYILSLCEIPGAPITESPWTPGARDAKDGEVVMKANEIHGKFLAAVRGQKFRGKNNQYDQGVWIIKSLPETVRAKIRERPEQPPEVQGKLTICRWDSRGGIYYAAFETLPAVEGGVQVAGWDGQTRWAERIYHPDQLVEHGYPAANTADIRVVFPLPKGAKLRKESR